MNTETTFYNVQVKGLMRTPVRPGGKIKTFLMCYFPELLCRRNINTERFQEGTTIEQVGDAGKLSLPDWYAILKGLPT